MKTALFFLLVAAIAGAMALTTIVSPGRLSLEALSLTMIGLAAFSAYTSSVPRFVKGGKAIEDKSTWHATIALVFAVIHIGGTVMFAARDVGQAWNAASTGAQLTTNTSHIVVFVGVASLVMVLFVMLRGTRGVATIVRVLAASEKTIEGRVEDSTPVEVGGEDGAVAQVVEKRKRGSDPEIVTEHTLNAGTFLAITESGERVEVNPDTSTWASSVRKKADEDVPNQKRFTDVVVIGGNVLIVDDEVGGRLFYATPSGTSPRARMRRLAAMRIGAALVLLACIAGMTARASQLAPRMPAFDLGENPA